MDYDNMSGHPNCTETPFHVNCSEDVIWEEPCFLRPSHPAVYAVTFVAVLIVFLVFLTVLSARTRLHSGLWYTYHLQLLSILAAIAFLLSSLSSSPISSNSMAGVVYYTFTEITGLLIAVTLVLLNLEVFVTILCRTLCFVRTAKIRFYFLIGIGWGIGVIWGLTFALIGINPCEYHWKNDVMYVVRGWITDLCLFVFIIIHTIWFIRSRKNPAILYGQAGGTSETSMADVNVQEWFIYIIIVDILSIVFDCVAQFVVLSYNPLPFLLTLGIVAIELSPVMTTIRVVVQRIMGCRTNREDDNEPTVRMSIDREEESI